MRVASEEELEAAARAPAGASVAYVFTAHRAAEVSEQLEVTLSAGDALTDQWLALLRDAMEVPAAMSEDQFKEELQAQGFVERVSVPAEEDQRLASVTKLCDASTADISTLYAVDPIPLGEGRFSKVYLVVEEATGQVLALKELDMVAIVEDDEGLEMLEAEVLALKRAGNAWHTVRLHKVVRSPDAIYLAMDRVPGRTLVDVVDEHGALKSSYVRHLMQQLLTALTALAEVGVVHRDVKPENIMVSEEETERPHLTLIDFGYAALLGEAADCGGGPMELTGVAGSPEYAAPEVLSWIEAEADETGEVEGEPYDAGCDVWSVGVTAHVLLCIELPFDLPKEATEEALVAAARNVDLSFRRLKGEARVRRGKMMARLEGEATMAPAREFVRACMTVARKERPTAQQLLGHPWILGPTAAVSNGEIDRTATTPTPTSTIPTPAHTIPTAAAAPTAPAPAHAPALTPAEDEAAEALAKLEALSLSAPPQSIPRLEGIELTSQSMRPSSELTSQSMRPSSELTSQSITEQRPSSELSADATPLLASDRAACRAESPHPNMERGTYGEALKQAITPVEEVALPNMEKEAPKLAITVAEITPAQEAALKQMQSGAAGSISGSISTSPAISQQSPEAKRIVTVEARVARPAISQHPPEAQRIVTVEIVARPAISQQSTEAQRIVTVERAVILPSRDSPEIPRDSPEARVARARARTSTSSRSSLLHVSAAAADEGAVACASAVACTSAVACASAAVQSQRDGSGDEDLDPDYRPVDSARSPAEGGLPNAWRPALSEELARLRVAHARVSAELEAAKVNATNEEQRRQALEALASAAQAQAAQLAASLGDRLRQAEQRAAQLEARLGVERGTQQQPDQGAVSGAPEPPDQKEGAVSGAPEPPDQKEGAVSGAPEPPDQKEEIKAIFAEMINEGAAPKPPAAPKVEGVEGVNGLPPQYAAALEVAKAEAEASEVAAAAAEAKAEVEAEAFKAQGKALATDAATDAAREEQGQGERAGGSDSANEAAGCAVTLLADGAPLELPPLELPGMQVLTTAPFPPLELPPEEESDSGELTVLSWTKGLGVHRAVAAALQAPLLAPELASPEIAPEIAPGAPLERIKNLTREQVTQLLSTRSFVGALVELVWNDLSKLPGLAEASSSTSKVLESKFAGAVELSYSGLDTFFGGLEGIVGSPNPNVLQVR
jgi:serine/threonine protein kinase